MGSPIFAFTVPLNPNNLFLLKIIFIIPPFPCASYLADGEVITSTFSIDSDGSCLSASAEFKPTKPDGFPLIKILTSSLPLSATLPSTSTEIDGTLSNTSLTEPPLTVKSLPTVYIFLSSLISTVVFSAIISTSSNDSISISNSILFNSIFFEIFISFKK